MFAESEAAVGQVVVTATVDRGHAPSFWAERAVERIVSVGGNCHPLIAQQADAFKEAVHKTVELCIKEAIKSDRTTLIAELERQGHKDMADILRRI